MEHGNAEPGKQRELCERRKAHGLRGEKLDFDYGAQGKPAFVRYGGQKYAYVYNLQGDVVALLASTGETVVQYEYDAWGKPVTMTGELADTLGRLNPFRYRGYVFDEETGLYYLRSRYYDPVWGRFVNADAYLGDGNENANNVMAMNLFLYCRNDPILWADRNGTMPAKGHVYADGVFAEASFIYNISIFQGLCYDSEGNVAEIKCIVGLNPEADPNVQPGAMGLAGITVAKSFMDVKADRVDDLAGKGSFAGCSIGSGLSIGIDEIVLGKYMNEAVRTEGEMPDGLMVSVGFGVGVNFVHVGNSYTYIRVTQRNGIPVPKEKQFWYGGSVPVVLRTITKPRQNRFVQ